MATLDDMTITVTARLRWWALPFLRAWCWAGALTGRKPDYERMAGFVARHGTKYTYGR